MNPLFRLVLASGLAAVFLIACTASKRAPEPAPQSADLSPGHRLVHVALELLDPANPRFNPDKGRAYLEFALRAGQVRDVDLPGPVLLELLKSERIASEKSHTLEQELEIMKEIDLNREEAL